MLLLHIQRTYKGLQAGESIYGRSKKFGRLNHSKILLVGMVESSHFQNWLKALLQEFPDKEIHIFPSDRPHLSSANLIKLHKIGKSVRIFKLSRIGRLNFVLYYALDLVLGLRWRAYFLGRFIIRNQPSIIHFHEMQHGAYIFNLVVGYKSVPNNSKNVVSTWGSDLNLYSWSEEHQQQIRSCLKWTDILTSERDRDFEDAQRLGFEGDFRAPVYITLGRAQNEYVQGSKPSTRRVILVKGYQDNPGRALNALQILLQLRNELSGYEIIVYSASEAVHLQVEILRNRYSLNIRVLPKVSNLEMRELFSKARVSISLSISDGLPGALVEAMWAGAFPIQSKDSAAGEFLRQGENGFVVDPWDLKSIEIALREVLSSDDLVDEASDINMRLLSKNFSLNEGIVKLKNLYLEDV